MTTGILFVVAFALGLAAQRSRAPETLRDRIWIFSFYGVGPVISFYSFSVISLDRDLAEAVIAAVLASWLVLGLSYLYGRLVASDRGEIGALTLAAGFSNTAALGYPLALVLFGPAGLALMVVYSQLAWLVPTSAVSTTIARLHGRRDAVAWGRRSGAILVNPPLLAAGAAVGLRLAGVEVGGELELLGSLAAVVVGPLGFFQVGLSLPLGRVSHGAAELRRATGVLLIRFGISPLVLLGCGLALGAQIPPAFYLGAAMPCAFHVLVLARVFEVRPRLVRLLVVASSVPAVAAVLALAAIVD